MKKKIVIAGANGFLGRSLIKELEEDYEVIGLIRGESRVEGKVRYLQWNGKHPGDWQNAIDGAFAVINLAGRSVNCVHSEDNKKRIQSSRIDTTNAIGQAIDLCDEKPNCWINASGADYYAYSEERAMTEHDPAGTHFLSHVCQQWEGAFFDFSYDSVRQVALRTTTVLGNSGGAFVPLKRLTLFGLGGTQGNGRQMFSWIHIDDFLKAVRFILTEESVEGPVNMAAPEPVTNKELMRTFRKVFHRKMGIPAPAWLLEIGAVFLRTETELILKSRNVVPGKLLDAGFEFQFPDIRKAVQHLKTQL